MLPGLATDNSRLKMSDVLEGNLSYSGSNDNVVYYEHLCAQLERVRCR